MTFAKRLFRIAGRSGLLIVLPMYFVERQYGLDYPPPTTHPDFYYGFIRVTVACQVMFLIINIDPIRYRPMMLAGVVEKFTYGIAVSWLIAAGHTPQVLALTAVIDLTFGVLFLAAFVRTRALEVDR